MSTLTMRHAVPALLLGCCAAFAQPSPMPAKRNAVLSFDMPYGGCRLMLYGDGSAFLAYGAAPAFVHVPAGTFDASAVKAEFKSRISLSRQRTQWPEPVGSLRFEGEADELWFNNAAFAQAVIDRALQHRLPSTEFAEPESSGPRSVVLHGCARHHRPASAP